MLRIKSAIFGVDRYDQREVRRPFTLSTSKGTKQFKSGDKVGIRKATSDKTKGRIIFLDNPNSVFSVPINQLYKVEENSRLLKPARR